MRILLIEPGAARRLPLVERILKEKLSEAHIENVEVESATVSEQVLELPEDKQPADEANEAVRSAGSFVKTLTRKLLNSADLILVMAKDQRNFLTAYMDYGRWNALHVFQHYCFGREEDLAEPECERENEWLHRQLLDSVEEGCNKIVQKVSDLLKVPSGKERQLQLK